MKDLLVIVCRSVTGLVLYCHDCTVPLWRVLKLSTANSKIRKGFLEKTTEWLLSSWVWAIQYGNYEYKTSAWPKITQARTSSSSIYIVFFQLYRLFKPEIKEFYLKIN